LQYDGVTDGAIYTRLKRFDKQNILKGILPDNDIFLNHHSSIEMQLRDAASYVKDLYKTEMGIAILHFLLIYFVYQSVLNEYKSLHQLLRHIYLL
jgi:hypothetical protein